MNAYLITQQISDFMPILGVTMSWVRLQYISTLWERTLWNMQQSRTPNQNQVWNYPI